MNIESVIHYFDTKNWNKISDSNLPAYFRSSTSRNGNEEELLSKVVKTYVSNPPKEIEIICLKTLTNSCCINDKKENKELKPLHSLYIDAIEHAVSKILTYSQCENFGGDEELVKLILKFVSNFLSMLREMEEPFEKLPKCMKSTDFKNSMMKLTQHQSSQVSIISCIYYHNAIHLFNNYLNHDEYINLYKCFLNVYINTDSDSAKFGLLEIIKVPNIFNNIYECSEMKEKKALFHIVKTESSQVKDNVAEEITLCLINRFNKISDKVTIADNIKNLQDEEPEEISLILDHLLDTCIERDDLKKVFKNNNSFVINCTSLLKMIHLCGKQESSCFAPMEYTKEILMASKSNKISKEEIYEDYGNMNSIAYGFKSKLITLIAHLVDLCKSYQDLVRELDGLSVIMDCCTWDAKNPFIKERAIIALRALCEGNLENQKQIQMMVKLEADSTKILDKLGLTLQDNDDGTGICIAPLKRK